MMATTFHKVRSSHPEDDADGRTFAPGDLVPNLDLTAAYNQEKIADGVFYQVDGEEDEAPPKVGSAEPDATSAAKRLAAEHDIDLSTIIGSGQDDRIEKSDVQAAIDAQGDANPEGDD